MKSEQARKVVDEAIANLVTALEQGKSETLTAYLAAMSRFHTYSWSNAMLIFTQKSDATHVAGFQTWKKLGRYVKQGERGLVIFAPMLFKAKENAKQQTDDEDHTILRFKAVYVFDVTQTDGQPLPEFSRVGGNPNGHTDRLKALVAAKGIALEYADTLDGPLGLSHGGRIQLLSNLPPAEEFSILTHELAHEILHKCAADERQTKTIRETEADAVAFVVCQAIGLDTNSANADYIQFYNGDKATLIASLNRIQQTASDIIQAITQ